jgi:polyphosphate kinase 2 (PPK2 family)
MLQEWVKAKGLRAVIVFEGRDGAGKGGTIKAITNDPRRQWKLSQMDLPSRRKWYEYSLARDAM